MPAQPYIPGWVRLVVHIDHEGSTMLLPQDYDGGLATITSTELDALCNDWWTTFGTALTGLLTGFYVVRFIEATDRSHEGGATGSYTVSAGGQGTRTGDATPANVANVISWRTGKSGRKNRGRTYLFGMSDIDLTGSYFNTSYLTPMGVFALSLLLYDGPPSLTVHKAVASISQLQMVRATGYVINDVADSQRRRLPGRGN